MDGITLEVNYASSGVGTTQNIIDIGDYGEVNVEELGAETFRVSLVKEYNDLSLKCVTTHDQRVIGIVRIPLETLTVGINKNNYDVVR